MGEREGEREEGRAGERGKGIGREWENRKGRGEGGRGGERKGGGQISGLRRIFVIQLVVGIWMHCLIEWWRLTKCRKHFDTHMNHQDIEGYGSKC